MSQSLSLLIKIDFFPPQELCSILTASQIELNTLLSLSLDNVLEAMTDGSTNNSVVKVEGDMFFMSFLQDLRRVSYLYWFLVKVELFLLVILALDP